MFYSDPVLSDSGATKNAKGRVRARGITSAREPPLSKFSQYLEIRSPSYGDVIALSYDSLFPFSLLSALPPPPPSSCEPNQYRYPGGRARSLSLPGKDETYNPVER